jgi:hypothetical protein
MSAPNLSLPHGSSATSKLRSEPQTPELDALDARLRHITDKIIPTSPYLLTVPNTEQIRLGPHQANEWRRNTTFDANEEPLQYMSFLKDRGDDNTILVTVGGWNNEKGELVDMSPPQKGLGSSGTNTPKQGPTVAKKISFADYTKKRASGQLGAKAVAPIGGSQAPDGSATAPAPAPATGVEKPGVEQPSVPGPAPRENGQKRSDSEPAYSDGRLMAYRSAETMVASDAKAPEPTASHVEKKPRRSEPPAPAAQAPPRKTVGEATQKPGLPPLIPLSLPSFVNLGSGRAPAVAAASANPEEKNKASQVSETAASKATASKDPEIKPGKARSEQNGTAHVRNSASTSARTSKTSQPLTGLFGGNSLPPLNITVSGKPKKTVAKPEAKKRMVVKLKIPKARRKDVARLLQTKSVPVKAESSKPGKQAPKELTKAEKDAPRTEKSGPKGISRLSDSKTSAGATSNASRPVKRQRADDDGEAAAPQSKRAKQPNGADVSKKPSTPTATPFKSSASSAHGGVHKARSGATKPETSNAPSRRLEAGEGDAKTPEKTATPIAPASVEKTGKDGRPGSSTSVDEDGWKIARQKYSDLARQLKNQVPTLLNGTEGKAHTAAKRLALATMVESFLCFMLSFAVTDEHASLVKHHKRVLPDPAAWMSLAVFMQSNKMHTSEDTLIHGLCLQLEALCRDLASISHADRLLHQPLPSVPRGEDAAKAAAEQKVYDDYVKFKGDMARNMQAAKGLWITGNTELSTDHLQQSFPRSWKNKSRSPLANSKERIDLSALNGEFHLPLSNVTTAIEAVRAGWSLLREWCKKEGVPWKAKLTL